MKRVQTGRLATFTAGKVCGRAHVQNRKADRFKISATVKDTRKKVDKLLTVKGYGNERSSIKGLVSALPILNTTKKQIETNNPSERGKMKPQELIWNEKRATLKEVDALFKRIIDKSNPDTSFIFHYDHGKITTKTRN